MESDNNSIYMSECTLDDFLIKMDRNLASKSNFTTDSSLLYNVKEMITRLCNNEKIDIDLEYVNSFLYKYWEYCIIAISNKKEKIMYKNKELRGRSVNRISDYVTINKGTLCNIKKIVMLHGIYQSFVLKNIEDDSLPKLIYMPELSCLEIVSCLYNMVPDITSLPSLKRLVMNDNIIEKIIWIPESPKLEELILSHNKIHIFDVPNFFQSMPMLKILFIDHNQLTVLFLIGTCHKSNIIELDASNNKIIDIYLENLPLETLNIHSNHITTIDLLTFVSCEKIKYIDCSKNELKFVQLYDFPQLEYLNMSTNKITELDLQNMPSMNFLNLNNNMLTNSCVIDNLPSLKKFIIADNNFQSSTCFLNFDGIKYLDLCGNPINMSLSDNIPIFHNLLHVELSRLDLDKIPNMSWVPSLKNINLSNNKISLNNESCKKRLANLTQLTSLDLSYNCITEFSFQREYFPPLIQSLNISNNLIKKIVFSCPDSFTININYLNLSHNHISEFPWITDKLNNYLESIIYLDISYNQLTSLPELIHLPNTKDFNLAHNHISSIPYILGPLLEILDISHNKLSYLSHSLLDIYSLDFFYYNHNPDVKKSIYIENWTHSILKYIPPVTLHRARYRAQLLRYIDNYIYIEGPVNYIYPSHQEIISSCGTTRIDNFSAIDMCNSLTFNIFKLSIDEHALYKAILPHLNAMNINKRVVALFDLKIFFDKNCNLNIHDSEIFKVTNYCSTTSVRDYYTRLLNKKISQKNADFLRRYLEMTFNKDDID